jgi:hypothetical protein
MTWQAWADGQARALRVADRWRAPRDVRDDGPIVFASNDYLGLTRHPAVVAAAHDALDRWGTGSGSARLIVGSRAIHSELEHELAEWKQMPRAALLPTGSPRTSASSRPRYPGRARVLRRRTNARSSTDAALAHADVAVYRHNDLDHLRDILRSWRARARRVRHGLSRWTATLDTAGAAELCARTLLVLDEAHAVLGPDVELAPDAEVLRVGTLEDARRSAVSSRPSPFRRARGEPRPAVHLHDRFHPRRHGGACRAARGALTRRRRPDGAATLVDRVRPGHPSPIVPFVIGEEQATLDAARLLLDRGILVPAHPPAHRGTGTVAPRDARRAHRRTGRRDATLTDVRAATFPGHRAPAVPIAPSNPVSLRRLGHTPELEAFVLVEAEGFPTQTLHGHRDQDVAVRGRVVQSRRELHCRAVEIVVVTSDRFTR